MVSKTVENMQRMERIAIERKKYLIKNITRAEKEFIVLLKKYQINFKFQSIIYTPKRYFIIDFLIRTKPKSGKIIEIDGSSHYFKKNYDLQRELLIKSTRWKNFQFIRIKNEQVFNGEAEQIVRKNFIKYTNKYDLLHGNKITE